MTSYNFKKIEEKWNKFWDENKTFKTDIRDFSKPKYYVLGMFPYPSGVALHLGHSISYTPTDIMARFKRMQGYNVLNPIGWDSFGLPSEQYAIETGNNPQIFTMKNIKTFKAQLKKLGLSYDWDREIATSDPNYYKWTQYIFTLLFNEGLARKVDMPVNWCEGLGTVLANDEVIDGKSERGGFPVVRKNMKQWIIDIPKYAEKLLSYLDELDWPESTKEIQRNWIGKSIGAEIKFKVKDLDEEFVVFTTRADTLFGATYCVLCPDHELVDKITTKNQKEKVKAYQKECAAKSDLERTDLNKDKTGVFTGAYAINPVNNKEIPIYIADYVLKSYGTGAIMAVPAHDSRDYEFAKKYNLDIIKVIDTKEDLDEDDGVHINSGFLDGLYKKEAIDKVIKFLEEKGLAKKKTNYKLREWIFARQRYWGEPIPILELENKDLVALPLEDLPLILPELDDYKPFKNGDPALKRASEWINTEYKGKKAKREVLTMPGSAGSSWYYLRYIDPKNEKELANYDLLKHWMPVDLYIGGPEHAVGHLLYARMWNHFLYEKGLSPVEEPFKKLFHQGMILGENGIKMGKRYKEFVVNPSDVIDEYGADALRLYIMFMGPLEADKPWSYQGLEGAKKFLDRVVRLALDKDKIKDKENPNLDKVYNYTVKKVTSDYENLAFNTAISQMMIFINEAQKEEYVPREYMKNFIKLLYPIAPYLGEELYQEYSDVDTITYEKWPEYNEYKLIEDEKEIAVQVNGKLRSRINIKVDEDEESVFKKALDEENVKKHLEGKEIIKKIYIKNKIVNIVVK